MTFATRLAVLLAISPLGLVTIALAMGTKPPVAQLTGVACEVVAETTGDKTTLIGRITPEAEAEGRFAVTVTNEGPGTRASTSQTGSFKAAAGETAEVGRSVISGAPETITAKMTVTVGTASRDCPMSGHGAT